MCFNADIERQFEFVQQAWINAPTFHGLDNEVDPFAAHKPVYPASKSTKLTLPASGPPIRLAGIQSYVELLGGGYFFMPGRRALWFLGGESWLIAGLPFLGFVPES